MRKKLLKSILFGTAILGAIFIAIPALKTTGTYLIFFFLPVFLVFVLIELKDDIKSQNTHLKSLFLISILVSVILILVDTISKVLFLPGAGVFLLISAIASIVTLIIGIIYFIRNRKNQNITFTYEMILLLLPVFIFLWYLVPFNTPSDITRRYSEQLFTSIHTLENINEKLADSSCITKEIQQIEKLKKTIVEMAGGYEESGMLHNFTYKPKKSKIIEEELQFINTLEFRQELHEMLSKSEYAGELLMVLTQIENELILKNCN